VINKTYVFADIGSVKQFAAALSGQDIEPGRLFQENPGFDGKT